jgi:hypothetical protein
MSLEDILKLILVFGLPGLFAFVPLFYPHKILQFLANDMRKTYKYLNYSDEDIDRVPDFPHNRALRGTRSQFINEAPDNPKKFPKIILFFRIMGGIVAVCLLFVLALIILYFISGSADL